MIVKKIDETKIYRGGTMNDNKKSKNRGATVIKGTLRIMIVMMILSVILFTGCTNPTKSDDIDDGTISPELVERIKKEFEEHFGYELGRFNYYGTHNGYVAFFVIYPELIYTSMKIAGTIFRYGSRMKIYLWKDSTFNEMIDAYLRGLITPEHIRKIGEFHIELRRKEWPYCDESFYEYYFNPDTIRVIIP